MPRYKITQIIDTDEPLLYVDDESESHEITKVGPSLSDRVSKTTETIMARLPKRQPKIGGMTIEELRQALAQHDNDATDLAEATYEL